MYKVVTTNHKGYQNAIKEIEKAVYQNKAVIDQFKKNSIMYFLKNTWIQDGDNKIYIKNILPYELLDIISTVLSLNGNNGKPYYQNIIYKVRRKGGKTLFLALVLFVLQNITEKNLSERLSESNMIHRNLFEKTFYSLRCNVDIRVKNDTLEGVGKVFVSDEKPDFNLRWVQDISQNDIILIATGRYSNNNWKKDLRIISSDRKTLIIDIKADNYDITKENLISAYPFTDKYTNREVEYIVDKYSDIILSDKHQKEHITLEYLNRPVSDKEGD